MGNGTAREAAARSTRLQPHWWLAALILGASTFAASHAQAGSTAARFRVTVDMVASCIAAVGLPGNAADQTARVRVACSSPVAYSVGPDPDPRTRAASYRPLAAASFIEASAPAANDSSARAWRSFAVGAPDSGRAGPAAGAVGILVSY